MGFLNGAAGILIGLGDDDSSYGTLARTLATKREGIIHSDQPGLVIIQVDGLAHDVLTHSLRAGRVPCMAQQICDGIHRGRQPVRS